MTTVTFYKTKVGEYTGFTCKGHVGFDNYGKDIVCAAVSALVINTINSLDEIVHEKITVDSDEKNGVITCKFAEPLKETSKVLMDSLTLGLTHITRQYGERYCKLIFKEA